MSSRDGLWGISRKKYDMKKWFKIVYSKNKTISDMYFFISVIQESDFLQLLLVTLDISLKDLEKWKRRIVGSGMVTIIHFLGVFKK